MSTLTATQLQQQYIAYFGRPGDPAGIKYWLTPASGISSAREFADKIYAQDEYKKTTIASKTTEEQVNSLYVNLFGRQADSAGLLYWTGEIQNGNLQLSNIAVNLIHAASNPVSGNESQAASDAQALANKVSAAESFTAELEKSTGAILAYQAESITPWVSGAAFASGVSFIKTATSSNAPTASDAASAVTTMIAASTAASVPDAKSLKLTANTDALVGDGGNDSISAVLQANGATGTTVAPGDSVDGKAGTDTFTISVAGDASGAYSVSALTLDNVEKFFVSNFDTNNGDTTVETGLMTGMTTVGLSSSGEKGDTILKGMKNNVDAEMRNGAADLTLTYDGTYKVTGTADTQKLTVSGLTAGSFLANGIETLNINSELVKSTLTGASSDALKTVNVTGDKDLTITNALSWAATANGKVIDGTLDASTFTGKLSVGVGGTGSTVSVKGGTADDTIKFADKLTTDDVVDGGAGTDTLTMTAAALDKQFTNVSNIETVAFDSAKSVGMDVSKLSSGVTTVEVDLVDSDAEDNAIDASTITNLGSETVVIKRTAADNVAGGASGADDGAADGVKLTITPATDTSDDTVNVTLDAVSTVALNKAVDELAVGNYETVNITNKKSTTVTAAEVATLTTSLAKSVTVSGDSDLTIGSITGGAMTSFDASALAGTLTATFATADKITAKAATKNTTFNFGTTLDNNDTVVGGAGTADEITAEFNGLTATTGKLTISDVETLDVNTSGSNTIDLSSVTGLKKLEVGGFTQTITGLDLATTTLLADSAATTFKVTAADATGSADTLNLEVKVNANLTQTVEGKNIETLSVTLDDSSDTSTFALTKFEGTTVNVTQKSTNTGNSNIALGTLHKNVTSVDVSGVKGTQSFSVEDTLTAATVKLGGDGKATVTGTAKADTFTIGKTSTNINHAITGGAGTDVLTLTVTDGWSNPSGLNVEDVTIDVVAGDEDVNLGGNNFNATSTALTLTGGNTLSSFTTTTTPLLATVKTFNASAFGGDLVLAVANNNLDDTVTITGGASTKDKLTSVVTGAGTDKPKTTGIETLIVDVDDSNNSSAIVGVIDLSNTTGVTTVCASAGADDTITIDKVTTQTVKALKLDGSASVLEVKLSDATGSTDTATIELGAVAGNAGHIADGAQLKTTDIETVTVKISNNAESVSLAGLSMTTAGETMKLVATGDKALTVSALNADVTTIDASGMGEGGSFVQTGRSSTAASTYTGSDGNDTFQMKNSDDAIAAGAGTNDTLTVTKNLILGGIKVDLSQTGDQVTTFNGNSNTAVQSGFESVDLSAITGSFGAEVTAIKGGSTIAGTPNIDVITLGAGSDTISLTGLFTAAKIDDISGWTSGSDKVGLDADYTTVATAAGSAAVANASAAAAVTGVDGADFNITSLGATSAKDIFILKDGDDGNQVAANGLGASSDGTTLLTWLGADDGGGFNAATGITVSGASNKFYIAAQDSGNTYLFSVQEGTTGTGNTQVVAGDIAYVGLLNGVATTASTDYTIVA
jgi:hypothetical protein